MKKGAKTVRPKRMKREPITIRVAEHILAEIDTIAYERGKTRSSWILDAIADKIAAQREKDEHRIR